MGIGAFLKGLSLFLQIALVIAAVVVGAHFLGLLAPVKHKLRDTPITINSIREIGQLYTAEYYGEVLSSYRSKLLDDIDAQSDSFLVEIEGLNEAFKLAIIDVRRQFGNARNRRIKRDAFSNFSAEYQEILNDPFFDEYYGFQKDHLNANIRNMEVFVRLLVQDTNRLELLRPPSVLYEMYKQNRIDNLTENRSFRKQQIILLGRGWVKAGFDFENFREENFYYDKERKRIYFFGIRPKILSHNINPWFIPEKNMKGFEIVMATGKSKYRPEQLEATKQKCLDLLLEKALSNKILDQAKHNAEENLKIFFSILLDEEIKSVTFMNESLSYSLSSVLQQDTILSGPDLFFIDSLMFENQSNPFITDFIDSLKQLSVSYDSSIMKVDRYLPLAISILWGDSGIDPFVDSTRMVELKMLKEFSAYIGSDQLNVIDSLWFYSRDRYDSLQQKHDQVLTQLKYFVSGKKEELEEKHRQNVEKTLFHSAKQQQITSFNTTLKFILDNTLQFGEYEMDDSLRNVLFEDLSVKITRSSPSELVPY